MHLAQRFVLVRHVAQAEGDSHQVKAVVGKWEMFGIADQRGKADAGIKQAIATFTKHGLVDVGVHDLARLAYLGRKSERQIAGAASDVKHPLAFLHVGHHHGVSLPGAMKAHRHQVVHHVVSGCHGVKNTANAARLVLLVDGFKTKMSAAHSVDSRPISPGSWLQPCYYAGHCSVQSLKTRACGPTSAGALNDWRMNGRLRRPLATRDQRPPPAGDGCSPPTDDPVHCRGSKDSPTKKYRFRDRPRKPA